MNAQRFALWAAVTSGSVLAPRAAHAHFRQEEPACYSEQDTFGSPQKSAPCGQADPGAPVRPTGAVTVYRTGDAITLRLNETIFHPGHYRVSIAQSQSQLPADPPVTAGSTACGSTTIDPAPALPVLADGVLVHTAPFSGQQSVRIPLPPNFTCTNCVLQVTEFMSAHGLNNPGGCFYHHCATVSILPPGVDAGTVPTDAGTTPTDAGSSLADASLDDAADAGHAGHPVAGCGCHTPASPARSSRMVLGLMGAIALVAGWKRRAKKR